ncbi:hypothetical protein BDC45DRAFT_531130 [Circinella umbellata]|nr:hypothetical protein BDC45DRAFT_531130 [Circinella umbellata]
MEKINSLGRSKGVDPHFEQRVATTLHNSSFPKKATNYRWITTITINEDNITKLKIGTTVSNLLVTSSIHVDKYSIAKNVVEIGLNTSNFIAMHDTKIYLNMESLRLGKALAEDEAAFSIDMGNYFYQLTQLRSKFHCLSTYTLCHSSSTFVYDIFFRLYMIWMLCNYDSAQQLDSQSQLLSQFFQLIAISVIKNGEVVQVKVKNLNDLHDKLKDGAIKFVIREFLNQQEDESLPVINNMKLNQLLTILADSMTTSIKNANAVVIKNFADHLSK